MTRQRSTSIGAQRLVKKRSWREQKFAAAVRRGCKRAGVPYYAPTMKVGHRESWTVPFTVQMMQSHAALDQAHSRQS